MLVNILGCFVGALCEVMIQMTVADVFFVHQRGLMNSISVWTLTIGSSLAPLAAGYVTTSQGWRWVWWWTAILIGVFVILMFFLYEETKYECQAIGGFPSPSRPSQGDLSRQLDGDLEEKQSPAKDAIASVVPRPEVPLVRVEIDPTIQVKPYWKKLALWSSSPKSIRFLVRHSYQPETRLWLILTFTHFVAAGLLMFGIGLERGLPWPFIAVGLGVASNSTVKPDKCGKLLTVHARPMQIISDTLVAVTFVKNLFPTVLVFTLTPWIAAVGLANVFITAAVIFVIMLLGNVIFIVFGKRFRTRSGGKYRLYVDHHLGTA
ncbi:uncharacterized protein A1O5_10974 [Cladophialophora psammophila CBS 110553]|uniref:Major facilitator superfamily (MFS) profile domain-containing protein n=1 Tax=Cladophialophora psammophila CBS 110553 TaxID=1182543 RepID=W9WD03_9EURO|nr:uncharacterized protein A1O5_10974 [Cladophialophora psammophila CBS 110553]EXJ65997.1 hypothetical protein A1O5_10974 [Cladophialophora psammophila CBS 110553]